MSAPFWTKTSAEVADLLAKEAVGKELLQTLGGYGDQAAKWLQDPANRGVSYGLAGAGLGGLLGAGAEFARDPEERNFASGALSGALAGGAMGGGAGLIHSNLASLKKPPISGDKPLPQGQASPSSVTLSTGETIRPAASPSADERLRQINQQLAATDQKNLERFQNTAATAAGRGLAGAAGAGIGATLLDQEPGAAILRGAESVADNPLAASLQARLQALPGNFDQQPLRRAALSAYSLDPKLPSWIRKLEPVEAPTSPAPSRTPLPDPNSANPLDQIAAEMQGQGKPISLREQGAGPAWRTPNYGVNLQEAAKDRIPSAPAAAEPVMPAPVIRERALGPAVRQPGRLFVDPQAPNRVIPGLTNADVKSLWSRGRRFPGKLVGGATMAGGLIPLIASLIGNQQLSQQQGDIAQGLSQ